tara:strand:+ start:307 stop:498 length:192 start_codon:yes stop_codon:yes gene_type:complete
MKYSLFIILVLLSGCGSFGGKHDGPIIEATIMSLWGHNNHEDDGTMMARKSFDLKELEQKEYN